jgi:hypothetical protein
MSDPKESGDCLNSAPNGADLRQKPWEAVGMSRATWYRRGKPTEKRDRAAARAAGLKLRMGMSGARSLRTLQRFERVLRKDTDLASAIARGDCTTALAELIVSDPAKHKRFRKWLKEQKATRGRP